MFFSVRCRFSLSIAVLGLSGVAGPASWAADAPVPLRVVATFSMLGDVVQQVGGERVKVDTLVGPGGDAHVFQPKPTHAQQIAQAQAIFMNGLGFEGWMTRLLKSANTKVQPVTVSEGIQVQKEHGHGHGHNHNHTDPHAWQSVPNVMVYVSNIATALCRVDASGCEGYQQRASHYTRSLQQLHQEIQSAWQAIPQAQRKVITTHDAFGYYAQTYGVKFLAAQGVSTDSEASAKGVAKLIEQIKKERIKALFVENISDARLMEQIGRETGTPAGGTLYSDSLSAADGPAASYVQMMRYNTQQLTRAIQATHTTPAQGGTQKTP
jgi:zinc/manganese transport system substrate-binding protein